MPKGHALPEPLSTMEFEDFSVMAYRDKDGIHLTCSTNSVTISIGLSNNEIVRLYNFLRECHEKI